MEIRRVTLIGLGAMGSFFAPRLAAGLAPGVFWVLAQGERKERLEKQGVTLNGVNYKFPVIEPSLEGEPADLVIMAVKDTGLGQAIRDICNQIGPDTQILCVMNGIESEERVAAAYGWEHVLYSYMRISIVMDKGIANFNPDGGSVHFGEKENLTLSPRVLAIKEVFDSCGIPYEIDDDMLKGLWFKFMCNVGENMTCALLGIPFGVFRTNEDANFIRRSAMREVAAIAQRKGIHIGEPEIAKQEKVIVKLPFENKPSTLQDLEGGRKTEIEMFSGTVIRLGEELGIDTPVNRVLYHGIKVKEAENERLCSGSCTR
ncbi:MAG: ketopantoate reductase family protein [Lachnospiraceae bacterium]|nr:ketopantoate reductase family protein [Lachnospiraceae bacterium]